MSHKSYVLCAALTLACAHSVGAQSRPSSARPVDDSSVINRENDVAVRSSGVWEIDGEYKGTRGEYYKLTGYVGYVAATSTSLDDGEAAVISMYLEPMAGGSSTWLGARLSCEVSASGTRCIPVNGAKQLLDLNIEFKGMPWRGLKIEAVISEPDDKDVAKRFGGRSSARGKFTMAPPA